MALPKKKGLRKITVAEQEFYWRLKNQSIDTQELSILIGVVGDPNKTFQLRFSYLYQLDILGLEGYFGKKKYDELRSFKNEIDIVKPNHVAEAIRVAIKNSWLDMDYKQQLTIRLKNGLYYKE